MIRLAIFARPPSPGRCKTRLIPALGEAGAAALHAAFVEDLVARVAGLGAVSAALHVSEAPSHPFFDSLTARFGLGPTRAQVEGDLGRRMAAALEDVDAILGTDLPTLSASLLSDGLSGTGDVALTPTADGGFGLVAARDGRFLDDRAIRWSGPCALVDTVRAARRAGHAVRLTAPHFDVDTPDDLRLLRAQLALEPSLAPCTARALAAIDEARGARTF